MPLALAKRKSESERLPRGACAEGGTESMVILGIVLYVTSLGTCCNQGREGGGGSWAGEVDAMMGGYLSHGCEELVEARMPWLVVKFDRGTEGGREMRNKGEKGGEGLVYLLPIICCEVFFGFVWHFFSCVL